MVQTRDERLNAEEPQAVPASRSTKTAGAKRPAVRKITAHAEDLDETADQDERDGVDSRTDLTDDERFDFYTKSSDNSVLPDLPPLHGYHVCWLTTTNPRDPIARRIRMGYTPVRVEELGPGWDDVGLKTGDYAGVVGINEMIAAKISNHLYQRYMRLSHHTRPLEDEEKLRANLDLAKDRAKAFGGNVQEGDGMAELVQRAPVPNFAA